MTTAEMNTTYDCSWLALKTTQIISGEIIVQGCKNPGSQVGRPTKFCTVTPTIRGSVMEPASCTHMASRIAWWLPKFWKICALLIKCKGSWDSNLCLHPSKPYGMYGINLKVSPSGGTINIKLHNNHDHISYKCSTLF